MNKRILLIADIDNLYIKRYIKYVLLPDKWDIVIFPIWKQTGRLDGFLAENNIPVYQDTHRLPVIRHIPFLGMWARILANVKALEKLGPFDAIHNHYLSKGDLALGQVLKRRFSNARWICTFWGSDLLRSSPRQLRKMSGPLNACDAITVISPPHVNQIQALFGKRCAEKTVVCDFGVDLYDEIDRIRPVTNKADCKARFGFPADRPLICLGYNASPTHRHLEILHALQALPDDLLKGWTLALQMTYGNHDEAYFNAVRDAASKLPCRTFVMTDFLDDTESAYLRLAADAFVLAIPTDAFSSSLQEYLYADAHVLCGDWLVYPQLDTLGIRLIRFQTIAQVPALLIEALSHPLTEEDRKRRRLLKTKYSWDALVNDWRILYFSP